MEPTTTATTTTTPAGAPAELPVPGIGPGPDAGRRERKKWRTRMTIAGAAAHLFATRGYDAVSVLDVAEAADVSEQTVYNHFPTKEHLVFDLADAVLEQLLRHVHDRPAGRSVWAVMRDRALAAVEAIGHMSDDRGAGGMPYLVATSDSLRRWGNDLFVTDAAALGEVLAEERGLEPTDLACRAEATALLAVSHAFLAELGRRLVAGEPASVVCADLRPRVEAAYDRLGRGLQADPADLTRR